MKKIILVSFITFTGCLTLSAQQSLTPMPAPNGQKVKVMTTQEANALNGTANPTINGKPYSQYKAEMQAKELADKKSNEVQKPQVPEQFRLEPNKKWSNPAPVTTPKVESQKAIGTTIPAESPVKVNYVPAELKKQPAQTEKPKNQ